MDADLAIFLTISAVMTALFLMLLVFVAHRQKMKKLEIELMQVKQANLQYEVEDAVTRKLGEQQQRIEVLEAIVSDKKYDLNEKISNLQ